MLVDYRALTTELVYYVEDAIFPEIGLHVQIGLWMLDVMRVMNEDDMWRAVTGMESCWTEAAGGTSVSLSVCPQAIQTNKNNSRHTLKQTNEQCGPI